MKKQIYRNNKKLTLSKKTNNNNNININKNNKIKLNYVNKKNIENIYKKVDDIKKEKNSSSKYSSRNEKNIKEKVNNGSSRNQVYYNCITNNRINNLFIYQETDSNKGLYKINPLIED